MCMDGAREDHTLTLLLPAVFLPIAVMGMLNQKLPRCQKNGAAPL